MEGLMCDITSFCTTTFDPLIAQSVHLYSNPKRRSVDPKTDDAKEVNWFMTLPKDIIVVVCNNLNHLDVIHLASSCKSLSAILQDPRILNRGHIHALFFPGVNGAKEMRKIPWMIRSKRNHFIDSPKKPFILRNTIESKFWQWEQTQNQQIGEQLRTDRKQLQLDSQVYAFGDLSEHLSQLQHTYATQIPSEIVNCYRHFLDYREVSICCVDPIKWAQGDRNTGRVKWDRLSTMAFFPRDDFREQLEAVHHQSPIHDPRKFFEEHYCQFPMLRVMWVSPDTFKEDLNHIQVFILGEFMAYD
eukprot:TRINITY_DN5974_c0_g2_i2.p1 TRINITY_DN5974_c0_g2~~TRINITY_DN5974_c0_g2_i2.p1  ORF type:complete len:301 (+),score=8.58 TRINITY_DN5974_c0_g2_i2:94-996(+)